MPEYEVCRHCGEAVQEGESYYDTPDGIYCEECYEFWLSEQYKRTFGDVIDLI